MLKCVQHLRCSTLLAFLLLTARYSLVPLCYSLSATCCWLLALRFNSSRYRFCFSYPTARCLLLATSCSLFPTRCSRLTFRSSRLSSAGYCALQADYCSARFEFFASRQSLVPLAARCLLFALQWSLLAVQSLLHASHTFFLLLVTTALMFVVLYP